MEFIKLAENIASLGILTVIAGIFLSTWISREHTMVPTMEKNMDILNAINEKINLFFQKLDVITSRDDEHKKTIEGSTKAVQNITLLYQRAVENNEKQMGKLLDTDNNITQLDEEIRLVRAELQELTELLQEHHIQAKEIQLFEESTDRRIYALKDKLDRFMERKINDDV